MERYFGAFQSEQESFCKAAEGMKQMESEQDPDRLQEAAGDVLLQICNAFRLKGINSEEALTGALEKLLKIYEIQE